MNAPHPTRRTTDADHLASEAVEVPSALLDLPWIDPHNHAHTLSWGDRERYALAGCRAMVMVASGVHWTPYKPVRAEDVRFLWDDAINRRAAIERNHGFAARLAVGVQTGARVEDPDDLLAALDGYCEHDAVVAVGETGVTPSQHVSPWPLDGQRAVVRDQMAIADRHDLPVLLHTPGATVGESPPYRPGVQTPGYEKNTALARPSVLDAEDETEAALEAVRLDVEAAADAGLAEERIVASHADQTNAPYFAEETDCYLSYTIGHPWLNGVTPGTVAEAIEAYGPERIMVDTDAANVLRSDVLAIKRAVFELYRLGVAVEDVRQVVFENPRDVFGLTG